MTLPAQDIVERLRFHGRYASESQDECTARKNAEREEAADTISRLTADNEALRAEAEAFRGKLAEACGKLMVAESRLTALEAEVGRLREALTPSADTKAAYSGEFYERIEVQNPNFDEDSEDDEPETIVHPFLISWTTTKKIMAAIRARAALTNEEAGQ